jgi:MarR family transcriptional regulator for hemolysin
MDDFENSVGCYIVDSARLMRKVFDRRVKKLGVTRSQWSVLMNLKCREGITQSELAELVEIEKPSLVRLLDKLEDSGMVMRKGDKEDRRIKRVYLTESAWGLIAEINKEGLILRKEFLMGISEENQKNLIELLGKVKHNLIILSDENI